MQQLLLSLAGSFCGAFIGAAVVVAYFKRADNASRRAHRRQLREIAEQRAADEREAREMTLRMLTGSDGRTGQDQEFVFVTEGGDA
jgi:hypothetical protein